MPKTNKVILGNAVVLCPCCGYALRIGATVRLKATREIGQALILDDDHANAVTQALEHEEAERHDG